MGDRLPFRRQHTGTFDGDQMQRQAQQAARRLNALADATDARLDALERAHGLGVLRLTIGDVDRTLTEEEEAYAQIVFLGTLTAGRTITVSRTTDAEAYSRWITNLTTGGFTLTIANTDGSATVANGVSSEIIVSSSGPGALV